MLQPLVPFRRGSASVWDVEVIVSPALCERGNTDGAVVLRKLTDGLGMMDALYAVQAAGWL